MVREEQRSRVRKALDELPAPFREMLVMRYLEHLTNSEVAAVLGISQRTAQSHHRQALERMQRLLGDSSPGEES